MPVTSCLPSAVAAETTKRPIHAVIGGFHLQQTPDSEVKKIIAEFKAMGIRRVGPTHCTGDRAMQLCREAYGDDYITGGVGTVAIFGGTS